MCVCVCTCARARTCVCMCACEVCMGVCVHVGNRRRLMLAAKQKDDSNIWFSWGNSHIPCPECPIWSINYGLTQIAHYTQHDQLCEALNGAFHETWRTITELFFSDLICPAYSRVFINPGPLGIRLAIICGLTEEKTICGSSPRG